MWELDYKESWALKNGCFWTVVLEKTLASPLDCREIQPVHPKGDQSWVFTGRTDVEAETPILWSPDVKSWLIWKDPDAGEDWRPKEKGTAEDEMAGWMASPTQWTWVWVDSRSWWWTGRPDVLWFMGSQSQTRLSDWTEKLTVGHMIEAQGRHCWHSQKRLCDIKHHTVRQSSRRFIIIAMTTATIPCNNSLGHGRVLCINRLTEYLQPPETLVPQLLLFNRWGNRSTERFRNKLKPWVDPGFEPRESTLESMLLIPRSYLEIMNSSSTQCMCLPLLRVGKQNLGDCL